MLQGLHCSTQDIKNVEFNISAFGMLPYDKNKGGKDKSGKKKWVSLSDVEDQCYIAKEYHELSAEQELHLKEIHNSKGHQSKKCCIDRK